MRHFHFPHDSGRDPPGPERRNTEIDGFSCSGIERQAPEISRAEDSANSDTLAQNASRATPCGAPVVRELPPDPGPPPPLNPSTHRWPDEVVTRGKELYRDNCWRCHGVLAMASNVLPDLRRSSALQDSEAWRVIVLNGALASQGMVSFSRFLSQSDVDAVRAYVDSEAQQAARGKSSTRPVSGHPQ